MIASAVRSAPRRALAALFALAALAGPQDARADEFYKGRTITLMVGLAAGGTVDTTARTLSAAWERHIPGRPTIIVRNMPAAGGLNATNYVYEAAARDGLTLYFGPWLPVAQALGEPGLRARYENVHYLGGLGDTRVAYARTDLIPGGLKRPADLARAKGFYVGGNVATGFSHLSGRLPLDMLGIEYKEVVGFRGGSDIFLAVQRGEIHYTATSIGTLRQRNAEFIRSGQGMALFYLVPAEADGSFVPSKYITEMPAFPDLYREIHGRPPSGPVWDTLNWFTHMGISLAYLVFAPPGTPLDALADLRVGFERLAADPQVNADAMRHNGFPWEWVPRERGERIIKGLARTDPKVVATFRQLLEKGAKAGNAR